MTKREFLIVALVLILIASAVAVWMYEKPENKTVIEQGTKENVQDTASATPMGSLNGNTCPRDQMQCADGTFVVRTPPDCRFICPHVSAAPVIADHGTLQLKMSETGKSSAGSGVEITPMGILEDSRCPVDVQCVQAGTVRLRVNVLTRSGVSTADLKLGEATTVGGEVITLVSVLPEKNSHKPTNYSDYMFTFKVGK